MWRSVRQTPQASTRTSNSPGPGVGSGSSAVRSGTPGRSSTMARIPLSCRVMRAFVLAAAIALVAAPTAGADILGTAQVRTADGKLLAAAGNGSFTYPLDGSVLSIGSVVATQTRVELDDVSMLGGRVHADRVTIRHGRRAAISGLVVQGLLRDAGSNALFQLDTGSYLVVSQKAVIGKKTGYVGLRLSVAPGYPGVPSGAQVLVGLRERGNVSTNQLANRVVTAA